MRRGRAPEHREKRQRPIVARALADRGDAALGDEVEAYVRSRRLVGAKVKMAAAVRFRLGQLLRLALARDSYGDGRIRHRPAAGLNQAVDADGGGVGSARRAQQCKDSERQCAARWRLLDLDLH